jgi:hypothetical protein
MYCVRACRRLSRASTPFPAQSSPHGRNAHSGLNTAAGRVLSARRECMRTLAAYGAATALLLASQVALGQPTPEPPGNPDEAGEKQPARGHAEEARGLQAGSSRPGHARARTAGSGGGLRAGGSSCLPQAGHCTKGSRARPHELHQQVPRVLTAWRSEQRSDRPPSARGKKSPRMMSAAAPVERHECCHSPNSRRA